MPKEVSKKKKTVSRNTPKRTPITIPRVTRDVVLFTAGLAGVFHQTIFTQADRPTLLLLFGAMIGLPAFLRTDESRKEK